MKRIPVSSKPEWYARQVLRDLAINDPPTHVESILRYFGLELVELTPELRKHPGAAALSPDKINSFLIQEGDTGTIWVLSELDRLRKKTSILHEVGHFDLPWHESHAYFVCKADNWISNCKTVEREAFLYAAEMMMPIALVKDFVHGCAFTVAEIRRFARIFDVSFEAAALRYVRLSDQPVAAIVLGLNANAPVSGKPYKVKYLLPSRWFPRAFIKSREVDHIEAIESCMSEHTLERCELSSVLLGAGNSWVADCELKWHGPDRVLGLLTLPRKQTSFHKELEKEHEGRFVRPRLVRTTGRKRLVNLGPAKGSQEIRR